MEAGTIAVLRPRLVTLQAGRQVHGERRCPGIPSGLLLKEKRVLENTINSFDKINNGLADNIELDNIAEEENDEATIESQFTLPPTIQESLTQHFTTMLNSLQSKNAELQQELENSRVAFDKYRDRARESLLKTASEKPI